MPDAPVCKYCKHAGHKDGDRLWCSKMQEEHMLFTRNETNTRDVRSVPIYTAHNFGCILFEAKK